MSKAFISPCLAPEANDRRKTILKVKNFRSSEAMLRGSKGDLVNATRYQIRFYQSIHIEAVNKLKMRIGPLALRVAAMADLYPSIMRTFNFPCWKR